jgi:hypothetical protein
MAWSFIRFPAAAAVADLRQTFAENDETRKRALVPVHLFSAPDAKSL